MLVDELGAVASHEHDRKLVEPLDLAQQPDPVHKENHDLDPVLAKMIEDRVLDQRRALHIHGRSYPTTRLTCGFEGLCLWEAARPQRVSSLAAAPVQNSLVSALRFRQVEN